LSQRWTAGCAMSRCVAGPARSGPWRTPPRRGGPAARRAGRFGRNPIGVSIGASSMLLGERPADRERARGSSHKS
jgi:hypothetical protein